MAFLDENGVSRLWTRVLSKLGSKVDKVDGKGLSTNDYTAEEKNKLAGIESGAQVNQNAIGTITADGETVFTSSTASDTFKLGVGSNITYGLAEDGTLDIGVSLQPTFMALRILSSTNVSSLDLTTSNTNNESFVRALPYFTTISLGTNYYASDGSYTGGVALDINGLENGGTLNGALQLRWNTDGGNGEIYQVYHSGMTNAIPISQGGTGAITASGALASLGAVSSYEPEFSSKITLVADSMPTIFMKATGGNTKQILIEGNTNNGLTFGISSDDTHTNRRYLGIYDPIIAPSLADALQLTSVDNGVYKSYNVFHSGAGGTFGGVAKANATSVAALEIAQLRNITISTTDLVEGESTLAEGEIYLVYDGGEA